MTGLFVPLDANWPDNPKVIAVGLDGAGLHAMAMCMAKRMETDGVLHRAHLARLGATPDLVDRLVEARLFDVLDGDRVRVHDWLDRNLSQGAIAADRTAKREAGKRGNHDRWGHPGPVEACVKCNPPPPPPSPPDNGDTGRSSHGAIPPDSPSDSDRSPVGSLETESEIETESERRDVCDVAPATTEARRLCEQLADSIGQRGEKRPTVTQAWLTDMDRLLRLDGRPPGEVEWVIGWLASARDNTAAFWRPNIRSPRKLREKWDQMQDQYLQRRGKRSNGRTGTQEAWEASLHLVASLGSDEHPLDSTFGRPASA